MVTLLYARLLMIGVAVDLYRAVSRTVVGPGAVRVGYTALPDGTDDTALLVARCRPV